MHAQIVSPGANVRLAKVSTHAPEDLTEDAAKSIFDDLTHELGELQELLYAAGTHSVLIVLQGVDTSGKDGAILNVLRDVNPVGCRVASFKTPTPEELSHDFLWRVHQESPALGEMVVFNRSHYEDVLIVRVLDLVPKSVWKLRYEHINDFERLLIEANTVVLKFYLHISSEEQEQRLIEREAETEKAWKLSVADWEHRKHWNSYQQAYADALSKCSTELAPWYIVPADQKWFRNLAIAEVIVEQLRPLAGQWKRKLAAESKDQLAALNEARANGTIPPLPEVE
jgi:PPK2 family polyphosphate:nucleotide phosphotransferase